MNNKLNKYFLSVLVIVFFSNHIFAQKSPTYKVGIFAPLYLDSVFNDDNYQYKVVPKFIKSAVDFVQGAQIALDSLKLNNENIQAYIFDTKSYDKNIRKLILDKELDSLNLMIGNVNGDDFRQLADLALQKNIPLISATYPNATGIVHNPFVVIMNPILKTHCDAIYSYIQQGHSNDKILICRQKGIQEDVVSAFFKQRNEPDGSPLLEIQTINFDNNLTVDFFKSILDSTKNTIVIGGSLDEDFSVKLAQVCYELKSDNGYKLSLFGMPTWDGFADLHKDDLKDFPIYFTTGYNNSKWDPLSKMVNGAYAKKYKTKPTDFAYKGFEATYMFCNLLVKHPTDFISQLNNPNVKSICDYNFMPVMISKKSKTPDYFENKHLYFLQILNGITSKAW